MRIRDIKITGVKEKDDYVVQVTGYAVNVAPNVYLDPTRRENCGYEITYNHLGKMGKRKNFES